MKFDLNREIIIYAIKIENIPIYIGSTSDVKNREKAHNKQLDISILENGHTQFLYDFMRNRTNDKLKLTQITKCYDDIVIIGENKFEYRRNIEEEKMIRYCLNKGVPLLNMVYPCKYDKEKDEVGLKRINFTDFIYKLENSISRQIFDYLKTKEVLSDINEEPQKTIDELLFGS